jgi:hypothetical protein
MHKCLLLGCSALLLAVLTMAAPANAGGRYYACGCKSAYYGCCARAAYYPIYPIYAPPSYTSLYYGTFRNYYPRRWCRWRCR